jgi:hypothetical protein
MPEPAYTRKGATFSPCKTYRYTLVREWTSLSDRKGHVLFVMLNPSTADENVLDPTVRRCLQYTIDWGYREMHVCNIFALRSTNPKQLYACNDPIGPDNDKCICTEVAGADLVIAAWGSHGAYKDRGSQVMEMITNIKEIHYLKLTKSGIPGHPLYLKGDLTPLPVTIK